MTEAAMVCVATWAPPGDVRHAAVSPAMVRAAVLDATGEVAVIDVRAGVRLARVHAGPSAQWVAIGDDGAAVAVIDEQRRIRVIPVGAPEEARGIEMACGGSTYVACDAHVFRDESRVGPEDLVFAPQGDVLVAAERRTWEHETFYGGGALGGEARVVAAWWASGPTQVLWSDFVTGSITYSSRDEETVPDGARWAVFSPRGDRLALGLRKGGRVVMLRRAEDRWVAVAGPDGEVGAAAFVPDGSGLVLARGAKVTRWDDERGERAGFVARGPVVALAGDDERVACVDEAGEVTVYAGGEPVEVLRRVRASPACAVRWTEAGLAVRCADGGVVVWR